MHGAGISEDIGALALKPGKFLANEDQIGPLGVCITGRRLHGEIKRKENKDQKNFSEAVTTGNRRELKLKLLGRILSFKLQGP